MKNMFFSTALLCGLAIVPTVVAAPMPLDASQFMPQGLPNVNFGSSSSNSHVAGDGASAGSGATAKHGGTSVSPTVDTTAFGSGANTQSDAHAKTIPIANGKGSISSGTGFAEGHHDADNLAGENLRSKYGSLNQALDNEEQTIAFSWDGGPNAQPMSFSNTVGTINGQPVSSSG